MTDSSRLEIRQFCSAVRIARYFLTAEALLAEATPGKVPPVRSRIIVILDDCGVAGGVRFVDGGAQMWELSTARSRRVLHDLRRWRWRTNEG